MADPKRAEDEINCIHEIMAELKEKAKLRPDKQCMYNHMLILLTSICTILTTL